MAGFFDGPGFAPPVEHEEDPDLWQDQRREDALADRSDA